MSSPPRVLIVSGIWPPDVGGPASHGPDLGRFLAGRGFAVRAIATGDVPAEPRGLPVHTLPRLVPVWRRMPEAAARLFREIRHADVVYATGVLTRTILGALPWNVPIVFKLVADPAFERARSLGWYSGSLNDFGRDHHDPRISALVRARDITVGRAAHVVVPSHYLASRIGTWSIGSTPVEVVPNPAPIAMPHPDRSALRRQLGVSGPTIVFAGRLVAQKNIPLAIRALRETREDTSLVIVGEGPAEAEIRAAVAAEGLSGERVRIVPAVSREDAVHWMQAADATVLSSDWENHPHAAVESLAVGTPVVATAVGGVPEIITDDRDGSLVPAGDARALGEALARVLARAQRPADARPVPRSQGPSEAEVFAHLAGLLASYASSGAARNARASRPARG